MSFAWLNELMIWLGKWFPRPVLITATQIGVWFGRRGAVVSLPPGLYWYWPIVAVVQVVSTAERTSEISAALHGREAIALMIAFRITDPKAMLLRFNDVFSQLDDRAQAALGLAYGAEKSGEDICRRVRDSLIEWFGNDGVSIGDVAIIQRGRVIPLKNIGDWALHAKSELC